MEGIALIFVAVWFFACFCVLPLWAILNCATSKSLGGGAKAAWIIGMLFTGFGFLLYIPLASRNRRMKTTLVVLLVTAPILWLVVSPMMQKEISTEVEGIDELQGRINDYQGKGVSFSEMYQFSSDLSELKQELTATSLFNMERGHKAISLLNLAKAMSQDGKIDQEDYSHWREKFEQRDRISKEDLKNYASWYSGRRDQSSGPSGQTPEGMTYNVEQIGLKVHEHRHTLMDVIQTNLEGLKKIGYSEVITHYDFDWIQDPGTNTYRAIFTKLRHTENGGPVLYEAKQLDILKKHLELAYIFLDFGSGQEIVTRDLNALAVGESTEFEIELE